MFVRYFLTATLLIGAFTTGFTADTLRITSANSDQIEVTSALTPGVSTLETASAITGPWSPLQNIFITNGTGQFAITNTTLDRFYRASAVGISPSAQGFTNLVYSYGIIETLAGTGAGRTDGVSYWSTFYEGGPGNQAALSRPHFAQADGAGNIYIADKNSHSILKLTPSGTIHTYAGTHEGGFDGDGPAPATSLKLNFPNGLWVRKDGVVYVYDTDNGRIRRVDTNGVMTTLFMANQNGTAVSGGRGLWVKDDETLAYFCAGTRLRRWTPGGGVENVATGFDELGTLFVEADGNIVVGDRLAHVVYRVTPQGSRTVIAGNGTTTGGGDGFPALATGLDGVRSPWPVPTGGWLLLTHDSSRLWYMDTYGTVRLLVNGAGGRTHSGDGEFFYSPTNPIISEGRSVTMDYEGNIILCESDYGYIRRIRFQKIAPLNP